MHLPSAPARPIELEGFHYRMHPCRIQPYSFHLCSIPPCPPFISLSSCRISGKMSVEENSDCCGYGARKQVLNRRMSRQGLEGFGSGI